MLNQTQALTFLLSIKILLVQDELCVKNFVKKKDHDGTIYTYSFK